MSFASALSSYCVKLGCTNREIAERCGISPSALSRYRSGERKPTAGAPVVRNIAEGIAQLARERGLAEMANAEEVQRAFDTNLASPDDRIFGLGQRLDTLMVAVGMSNTELAESLGVDQSTISRVRNGLRRPTDFDGFAQRTAQILVKKCSDANNLEPLATLARPLLYPRKIGQSANADDQEIIQQCVENWLKGAVPSESGTTRMRFFLERLNDFSPESCPLFDDKPVEPKSFGADIVRRQSHGALDMYSNELEFMWRSLGTGASTFVFGSDMPYPLIEDSAFFVEELQSVLKAIHARGGRVMVIHDLDCSTQETLSRIGFWMPMYLSGTVSSYYITGLHSQAYPRMGCASDTCAFLANSIMGYPEDCWSYLTNDPDEVAFHLRRASHLMELAQPLFEVFREEDSERMAEFEALVAELKRSSHVVKHELPQFEHVTVVVYPYDLAIVTRTVEPVAHFVVRHPKLCHALYLMGNETE